MDDPTLGVLGGLLRYPDGRLQPSVGYEHTPVRIAVPWFFPRSSPWLPRALRRVESRPCFYAAPRRDVAWVSGAFLLTRRAVWRHVRGMDELFFMYIEDVDYCRRVRQSGFRVDFTPEVELVHHEGMGRGWAGPHALDWTVDSYFAYTRKFGERGSVGLLRALLHAAFTLRAAAHAARGAWSRSPLERAQRDAYWSTARRIRALASAEVGP
jgi:GT2 family glycosyltransferase